MLSAVRASQKKVRFPLFLSILPTTMCPKKPKAAAANEPDALHKMRHSIAHLLTQAMFEIRPNLKYTIGPPIENGLYFDYLFDEPITPEDFPKLEKLMRGYIREGQTFERRDVSIDEAIAYWKKRGQPFKVELIEDLVRDEGVTSVSHYANIRRDGGEAYVDLCRGGHVENTNELPLDGFKITHLAGAYWRGDEKREQLTRVYVAAFPTKEELDAHLHMLEEARKRDHRKIGKELDLFTFSDLVGPGLPLWTPRGTLVRQLLDGFVWELRQAKGYERVTIPHITKKELYEMSGHWQKFASELFHVQSREGHDFAMKPMNCPHHTQIYAHLPRSYKDLPQRYAETTTCYRDEQTGELHGLSRLRAFTQDDAHVFCRQSQVKDEFLRIWDIVDAFYRATGFSDLSVRLSLHDPAQFEKYLGTPDLWRMAEAHIRDLAKDRGVAYVEAIGEAAFYGPKVDFIVRDSIGRQWQVATIQLDINMPERFDLSCTNEHGEKERIVMVHAAIMGSIERFLSIFLEHHAGHLPLWVAPVQAAVLPVAAAHEPYAAAVIDALRASGIRTQLQGPEDSLGKRIRDAEQQRIPLVLVLGDKEADGQAVAVRVVKTKEQTVVPLKDFVRKVEAVVRGRELEMAFS
ncbi:MAG: threonyl-tRNA synthetase [Candidatus Peregrinibacteria bacterium Gr01-1014_25]|nr:MAG: threonyl-tRNA synthetase [Candidatus Peregrinibacteria bacterium Gr01-1014_25]